MQTYTASICSANAASKSVSLTDARDGQIYTARYINGNCWMTQDLRFIGSPTDISGTMTLNSTTSNIPSTYTEESPLVLTYYDPTSSYCGRTNGNGYIYPCAKFGSNSYTDGNTVWYNYAAASAGTTVGASNSDPTVYDICPAGWRLPTGSEGQSILGYSSVFNVHYGGGYDNGAPWLAGQRAYWWTSTLYSSDPTIARNAFRYVNGSLSMDYNGPRSFSWLVRCIRSS